MPVVGENFEIPIEGKIEIMKNISKYRSRRRRIDEDELERDMRELGNCLKIKHSKIKKKQGKKKERKIKKEMKY